MSGRRYYVCSPFRFRKTGEAGPIWRRTGATWPVWRTSSSFYRGCQVDSVNHPTAMYQMNCGNRFADPGLGGDSMGSAR